MLLLISYTTIPLEETSIGKAVKEESFLDYFEELNVIIDVKNNHLKTNILKSTDQKGNNLLHLMIQSETFTQDISDLISIAYELKILDTLLNQKNSAGLTPKEMAMAPSFRDKIQNLVQKHKSCNTKCLYVSAALFGYLGFATTDFTLAAFDLIDSSLLLDSYKLDYKNLLWIFAGLTSSVVGTKTCLKVFENLRQVKNIKKLVNPI